MDQLVEKWFSANFMNKGFSTPFYNVALAAKEDLKKRLQAELQTIETDIKKVEED